MGGERNRGPRGLPLGVPGRGAGSLEPPSPLGALTERGISLRPGAGGHPGGQVAFFMDRDGTLSREVGYVNHESRFELLPGSARAVRRLNEVGVKAIVLTNQAGVARGYFPEWMVEKVHAKMERLLAEEGARLDGIYWCPHHPEGRVEAYRKVCDCRKPSPGLLLRAAADHGVEPARSFVVGDRGKELEMARRVGARTILVKTGYGLGELELLGHTWPSPPDHVAEDLLGAVEWALAQLGGGRRAPRVPAGTPGAGGHPGGGEGLP